jgi:hypothetical protein
MYTNILTRIRPVEDAEQLRDEADVLLSRIYEDSGKGLENALRSEVRLWLSEILESEFQKEGCDIEDYLRGLKNELDNISRVEIFLGFEPTLSNIDKFYSSVSDVLGDRFVLDVKYRAEILGGAVLVYKGKYKDCSLNLMFDSYFEINRDKLMEKIKSS